MQLCYTSTSALHSSLLRSFLPPPSPRRRASAQSAAFYGLLTAISVFLRRFWPSYGLLRLPAAFYSFLRLFSALWAFLRLFYDFLGLVAACCCLFTAFLRCLRLFTAVCGFLWPCYGFFLSLSVCFLAVLIFFRLFQSFSVLFRPQDGKRTERGGKGRNGTEKGSAGRKRTQLHEK